MEHSSGLPAALRDLQELSTELGKVSLLGACGLEEEKKQQAQGLPLTKLLRLREQVKHQHHEIQNVIEASEEAAPEILSFEKLAEISEELEKDIEAVKVSYQNKTLVLQRMQLANALHCKLQEGNNESKLIQDKLKHILALSSSILKSQQETREMEQKLYDIQKKRLVLKELGSKNMLQIQELKSTWNTGMEEMNNPKIKMMYTVLKKEIDNTTVIQSVLQNIILASHVDWAKDPKLREVVLNLETNPSSFM